MFRFVVSLLMLCSFAVHAALGCHWHHGHGNHAHETPPASEKPAVGQAHLGPCSHHNGEHSDPESDSAPAPPTECPDDCDGLTCTYLTTAPTKLPMPRLQPLDDMPRLAMAILPGLFAEWQRRSLEESTPPRGRSSARDLTQVWQL